MIRLLLLLPTTTYRSEAFVEAARKLDAELVVGSERDSAFSTSQPAGLLTLDFQNPSAAAARVGDFARRYPIQAVFGVDDQTAVIATVCSHVLGLPHNPIASMEAARDKYLQRRLLRGHDVPVPDFSRHSITEPVEAVIGSVHYPCVLKPTSLAASRGVIRANDPEEFRRAHARLAAILSSVMRGGMGSEGLQYLVEGFVSGPEFALEGVMIDGRLHVLALFDKPDPLEGPFFEETIYVTPSRVAPDVQLDLTRCAERAAQALGLERGPVHVELRHNGDGPWLIELAARPIGGKCGQVLRFGSAGEISLEQLLLGQLLGVLRELPSRERAAAGVMMIPIPRAGVLRGVKGIDAACSVAHVTDVIISAHRGQRLVPLPDESRYLGFIFARAERPGSVERALREAHAKLAVDLG